MLARCFARIRFGEGNSSDCIKNSCPALVVDLGMQLVVSVLSHCQSNTIKTVLAYELLTVAEQEVFWFISKVS